jgi:hypothetical protein
MLEMSTSNQASEKLKGSCFVVMGFGRKTDFETGRVLDLDKTYEYIIKPAVESTGLVCVRANEIKHSGPIDVPMYENLLQADVVVADLSTSNKNAYYELGVRHALKPYTTVVVCEDKVESFPFDLNHVSVQKYRHLGDGIDFGEVERFRKALSELVIAVYRKQPRRADSPVYTTLQALRPPALSQIGGLANVASASPEAPATVESFKLYSELLAEVDAAQASGDFEEAKMLLALLRKRMRTPATVSDKAASALPEDPYIIQRLALATYKAKKPTPEASIGALREAAELLSTLSPATSNDTETLGLWGAVHKRLWEQARDAVALDQAVRSYERGFYLRNDYYNGINFAYLLNIRAARALAEASGGEALWLRASAISDFVRAQQVRSEVLAICQQELSALAPPEPDANPKATKAFAETRYWITATKAEAAQGVLDKAQVEQFYVDAYALAPLQWMVESTQKQRVALEGLLADAPLQHVQA